MKKNQNEPEAGERRAPAVSSRGESQSRHRDDLSKLDLRRDWLETDKRKRLGRSLRHALSTAATALLLLAGVVALVYFLVWKPMTEGQGPFARAFGWLTATEAPTPTPTDGPTP